MSGLGIEVFLAELRQDRSDTKDGAVDRQEPLRRGRGGPGDELDDGYPDGDRRGRDGDPYHHAVFSASKAFF